MESKRCGMCGETKPHSHFYVHKTRGRQGRCIACTSSPQNKETRRLYYKTIGVQHRRRRHYGITPDEYQALLTNQGGRCAICKSHEPLVIDHDHKTHKVRGLLCDDCNVGIGKLQDSVRLLEAALSYLGKTYG